MRIIRSFIIGMLLTNGMPHFIWGRSGTTARSPFGPRTEPQLNILWGLSNFAGATLLALWKSSDGIQPVALLAGAWGAIVMFWLYIGKFVGTRE